MYKCLIVDDNVAQRVILENYIQDTSFLSLTGSVENTIEAQNVLLNEDINILLLDIEMPGLNGLDFLKTLQRDYAVIITTSHQDYAIDAIKLNVWDYLIKPIPYKEFLMSVNKVIAKLKQTEVAKKNSDEMCIFLKEGKKIINVALNDIVIVEGNGDYTNVILTDKTIMILSSMQDMEKKLPTDAFVRIHRSYIVAIKNIKSIEGDTLSIGKRLLPISRTYKNNLMNKLNIK